MTDAPAAPEHNPNLTATPTPVPAGNPIQDLLDALLAEGWRLDGAREVAIGYSVTLAHAGTALSVNGAGPDLLAAVREAASHRPPP